MSTVSSSSVIMTTQAIPGELLVTAFFVLIIGFFCLFYRKKRGNNIA